MSQEFIKYLTITDYDDKVINMNNTVVSMKDMTTITITTATTRGVFTVM